jgi:hypothetical protein
MIRVTLRELLLFVTGVACVIALVASYLRPNPVYTKSQFFTDFKMEPLLKDTFTPSEQLTPGFVGTSDVRIEERSGRRDFSYIITVQPDDVEAFVNRIRWAVKSRIAKAGYDHDTWWTPGFDKHTAHFQVNYACDRTCGSFYCSLCRVDQSTLHIVVVMTEEPQWPDETPGECRSYIRRRLPY